MTTGLNRYHLSGGIITDEFHPKCCYSALAPKKRITIIHSGTGMFELPVPDHGYNQVNAVGFFPAGGRLLIAGEKTGVRVWAMASFGLRFMD